MTYTALTVATVLGLVPASAGAVSRKPCPSRPGNGVVDVFGTGRAVVYARRVAVDYAPGVAIEAVMCDRRSRRRVTPSWDFFGPANGDRISPNSIQVKGPYVAWSWAYSGGDGTATGIDMYDVRRRESVTVVLLGLAYNVGPVGPYRYIRLALRRSGALAWTTKQGVFACATCFSVGTSQPQRPVVTQLADGVGLEPRSLRVTPRGWPGRRARVCITLGCRERNSLEPPVPQQSADDVSEPLERRRLR